MEDFSDLFQDFSFDTQKFPFASLPKELKETILFKSKLIDLIHCLKASRDLRLSILNGIIFSKPHETLKIYVTNTSSDDNVQVQLKKSKADILFVFESRRNSTEPETLLVRFSSIWGVSIELFSKKTYKYQNLDETFPKGVYFALFKKIQFCQNLFVCFQEPIIAAEDNDENGNSVKSSHFSEGFQFDELLPKIALVRKYHLNIDGMWKFPRFQSFTQTLSPKVIDFYESNIQKSSLLSKSEKEFLISTVGKMIRDCKKVNFKNEPEIFYEILSETRVQSMYIHCEEIEDFNQEIRKIATNGIPSKNPKAEIYLDSCTWDDYDQAYKNCEAIVLENKKIMRIVADSEKYEEILQKFKDFHKVLWIDDRYRKAHLTKTPQNISVFSNPRTNTDFLLISFWNDFYFYSRVL